ncbi:MAG TPA: peptidoglycan DD-metalloendopeptidase family protein, partial [Chitinophagaceae bacterium]|nr:peptidoglycan DD-metalloendopeptidase family protein [Chitinophagaceae bacterium]
MRKKILLALIAFAGMAFHLNAQTQDDKTTLERERQAIQNELKEIQGVYNKVKGQSRKTLSQLGVINRKINLQERYIGSISKEIRMIDDDIYRSNLEIFRLTKQLDTLKSEYARTVVYAYKNRSSYDYLNFIFSAGSFNDAIKRIAYLKSYRSYREQQVKTINETQDLIAKRKQQQLERKGQKNMALKNQTQEKTVLDVQKKEKAEVLTNLKSQEKDLQKQIATRKKKDRDLRNAITAIIRREIEAAKKEAELKAKAEAAERKKAETAARKTTTPSTSSPETKTVAVAPKPSAPAKKPASYLELNDKEVALGSSFSNNRGKLPWPVDNGVVTIDFGPYSIEGTLLKGDNPGITIATQVGNTVKSVFEGEVVGVYNLGDGMAVTIRHGKYFTTYSNLSSASVRKGE